jgi:hypothetical protein
MGGCQTVNAQTRAEGAANTSGDEGVAATTSYLHCEFEK